MSWRQTPKYGIISLALLLLMPATAWAASPGAQSSSSNYQVNEVFFGSGGALNDCSAHYCAKESAGETAVGNTGSANFQAQAGFNTDRNPYLQFIVNGTNIDVGGLSTGNATTATATFSVKNYLSQGYVVTTVSPPPTDNSYTMNALGTASASSPGTEQFGINLVKNNKSNSNCAGFSADAGADPVQVPNGSVSFGAPASGYNTACFFKYVQNDTIAGSTKSSGETDYTITYLYNISNLTPGGAYDFNDVLVATATF